MSELLDRIFRGASGKSSHHRKDTADGGEFHAIRAEKSIACTPLCTRAAMQSHF
jgi:hypothetical protein